LIAKFQYIEKYDKNKDGFLTYEEFRDFFRDLKNSNITCNNSNKIMSTCNIDLDQLQLNRLIHRLVDQNNDFKISTANFVFLINYFENFYSSQQVNTTKFHFDSQDKVESVEILDKINKFNFFSFYHLKNLVLDISHLIREFHSINFKGVYSGLLIYFKSPKYTKFSQTTNCQLL
jgi:hypothetical protein